MTKKLGLYIAFLVVLTFALYAGMKSYFTYSTRNGLPGTTSTVHTKSDPTRDVPMLPVDNLVTGVELGNTQLIVPSPEGNQFAALLKPDVLTILDAQSGEVLSRTVTNGAVQNVTWISERLLFYMTSNHSLYTFDTRNHAVRLIHWFQVSNTTPFQTVALSSFTNDVFVIFSGQGGNTVYQFNTNGTYFIRSFGNLHVLHAFYTATTMTLYLEDTSHTLYQVKNGYLSRLRQHSAILRGAGNVLYYAVLNANNEAISVAMYDDHGTSHLVSHLANPAPLSDVAVDHAGNVYVATSNMLTDAKRNLRWAAPSGFTIRTAGNNVLLTHGNRFKVVLN